MSKGRHIFYVYYIVTVVNLNLILGLLVNNFIYSNSVFVAKILRFFMLFAFVFVWSYNAQANPLYASFVIDADSGTVLHSRNANKRLHPASLTKVMTLLMLFESIDSGKARMSDKIYVSTHAASMVPSKLGLKAGSNIRVRDAILALSVKSANDIAVAVAEHLGGSERNFARMMTFRAHQLGMKRTVFMNASGLNHRKQISTARDMAVLARYVIQNHPDYYKFYGRSNFTYRGVTYRNHNGLMKTYPGMDGMKTGYIGASGFNLISSAVRDGRRIVGVVFGGRSSRSRNAHMARLLDDGFRKLPRVRVAKALIPSPTEKPDFMEIAAASIAAIEPAAGDFTRDYIPPPPIKYVGLSDAIEQGSADYNDGDVKDWSIQVGAFKSKNKTLKAIRKAVKKLPAYYKRGEPHVAPLTVANSFLYRARLTGYSAHDAYAACAYIEDCITISP